MPNPKIRVEKIGNIRAILPADAQIIDKIDLEQYYKNHHIHGTQPERNDALLTFKYKNKTFTAIIEETGVPKLNDLTRLYEMPNKLKQNGLIKTETIIIKILHHKGIKTGKRLLCSIAQSYRIELQECHRKSIDLALILTKRRK